MAVEKKILGAFAPWCLVLEVSVGAVVFRRVKGGGVQYMMLQYPHGHWEFPRGHMEDGETEDDTMRRETQEETGITDLDIVSGFRESMSFSYTAKGDERKERIESGRCLFIYKNVHFYLAQTHTNSIRLSHEHKNYAWLPFEAAYAKLSFDNGRRILTAANEHLTVM